MIKKENFENITGGNVNVNGIKIQQDDNLITSLKEHQKRMISEMMFKED